MSKDSEFCLERELNLHMSAFKYSLPTLHKYLPHMKIR